MKASEARNKMKSQQTKSVSTLRNKFQNQKQDLLKRHQEQVDTKDQGNEFPTIFDKAKFPKGIGLWKCNKGEHELDIIPFFAGSQHPRVEEGELAYVVDLFVHTNVGPLRMPYPCEVKNFKETDPICEYIAANRLSKEEWKRVSSKRRTVYLVWVHDTPEEEKKGIQIWEVSHFFFEQHIDEIAKSPRGGGALAFSDISSGKSIAFTVKVSGKYKDGDTDRDSIIYTGHRFVDRQYDVVPDWILEQSFSLDECILMHPDYDEVEEAFNPSASNRRQSSDEEPAEEVREEQDLSRNDYDPEEDIPSEGKKVTKGSNKKRRPEPEPEPLDEKPTEEEVTEEEEAPIACPVCNGKGKSKKGQTCPECNGTGVYVEENPEEEITEEENLQEFETGEEEIGEEVTECPHDPDSFGEVDEHPECEADGGCSLWDLCSDEANRRKKEEEVKKPLAGKKPLASSANKPKRKLGR